MMRRAAHKDRQTRARKPSWNVRLKIISLYPLTLVPTSIKCYSSALSLVSMLYPPPLTSRNHIPLLTYLPPFSMVVGLQNEALAPQSRPDFYCPASTHLRRLGNFQLVRKSTPLS